MSKVLARRQFLKGTIASAIGVALHGCGGGVDNSSSPSTPVTPTTPSTPTTPPTSDTPGRLSVTSNPKRIVIIGAGAAGLVAGYELQRAGHDVVILEGRERVGGRINTLRTPFSDGLFAEAGASRIPSEHDLTLAYCDHFDVSLTGFYPDVQQYFLLTGGNVQTISADTLLSQPPWPGGPSRSSFRKIVGGMEQLPLAFLNAFDGELQFQQIVTQITQGDTNVVVQTDTGNQFEADKVLCTLPIPVLDRITFSPQLSGAYQQAINGGFQYAQSSRVFYQCRSRFWDNAGLNGWGDTDLPEEIWQPQWDTGASGGIIQSYLRRSAAESFELLDSAEQIRSVRERLSIVLPDLESDTITTHVHSWSQEPLSGAAFADPTLSQQSLQAQLHLANGHVHFAGEHLSDYHGWIQGALQSGIRAATEIHNS